MRPLTVPTVIFLACLATLIPTACSPALPEIPDGPRAVVLISLDTLRPGRLGLYGNTPDVSPRIDALAHDAVVFDQALASAPWTLPSHMTMLTGLDPVAHGVRSAGYKLSRQVTTLAEHLAAAGYATAAFTDGGFVAAKYGFDQGFDLYDDQRARGGKDANGFGRTLPAALDWVADHADQDFFLFLHSFDAHGPYDEGDPEVLARFRERDTPDDERDHQLHSARWLNQQRKMRVDGYTRLSELLNDYDAGVHMGDRGVGAVLDKLHELGRLETALVIVTSDHGEAMFDHDFHAGHGMLLTDSELHVPLIVRFPAAEGAGTRHDALVGLTDLAPTVLEVCSLEPDPVMQGSSLRQLVRGEERTGASVLAMSTNTETYALVRDGHKFISPGGIAPMEVARRHIGPITPPMGSWHDSETYTQGHGDNKIELSYDMRGDPLGLMDIFATGEQLFDRARDPDEQHNVTTEQPIVTAELRSALLEQWEASTRIYDALVDRDEAQAAPFNPHELHALAMLGYLDTGSSSDLRAIPEPLRDSLLDTPHEPPDTSALDVHDRRVHAIRVALSENGSTAPDAQQILTEAGDAYVAWGSAHQAFAARAIWRLLAVIAAGEEAGLSLDTDRWVEQGRALSSR